MKSALVAVALVLGTVLVIWGGIHVMIQPVNPAQEVPKGHFSGACWACHFVSDGVELVEE